MYINPFIGGILFTILFELAVLVVVTIIKLIKENKNGGNN